MISKSVSKFLIQASFAITRLVLRRHPNIILRVHSNFIVVILLFGFLNFGFPLGPSVTSFSLDSFLLFWIWFICCHFHRNTNLLFLYVFNLIDFRIFNIFFYVLWYGWSQFSFFNFRRCNLE